MKNNKVATTIKLEPTLYDEFKVLGIHCRISLQSLVERCVYRYVKEEPFRNDVNNFNIPLGSDPVEVSTPVIPVVEPPVVTDNPVTSSVA